MISDAAPVSLLIHNFRGRESINLYYRRASEPYGLIILQSGKEKKYTANLALLIAESTGWSLFSQDFFALSDSRLSLGCRVAIIGSPPAEAAAVMSLCIS